MRIRFSKMHGLGNDFMVIDAIHQSVQLTPRQIRTWADRRFGVGFDQLLLVETSTRDDCAFRYRIFNADGGEVEQCGNGARCFAAYVTSHGLTALQVIPVETLAGRIVLEMAAGGLVTVDMGCPRLDPQLIPFEAPSRQRLYPLEVANKTLSIAAVSMGNPHLVWRVDNVSQAPVAELGPLLERHPRFPQRVNAGFMQVLDRTTIALRVYERGAGETLACGTGACAAAVAGILNGWLDECVTVRQSGGDLVIRWAGEGMPVRMTGPAVEVYTGEIDLERTTNE